MSRTQSQGIEYFPMAVDFCSDKKIKVLKARYGADGVAVYVYLLCQVYREGYYTRVDEDFIYMISDDLNMSSDKVQQVMTFLFERSMFNEQLFKSDAILTSTGIQERWQKAISTRARKSPIEVSKYWLLNESETQPFIKCTLFNNSSEKKDNNSENYPFNSENYSQRKVKESKVNNISLSSRTREETDLQELPVHNIPKEFESKLNAFTAKWGVVIDGYNSKLAEVDFDALDKAFEKSPDFLQTQPPCKAMSWVLRNYAQIIAGKYAKFEKAEKPKDTYDPYRVPWRPGAVEVIKGGES